MLGKGASVDEVCRVTGLSKGAVITLRNTMKLPPERASERPAAPTPMPVEQPRTQESNGKRASARAAVKDWSEDDFADFIKFWNATPVREKACEAYSIDVEALDYILFTLKRGGVMLRKPQKIALNFEKLRQVAEESLPQDVKAAIKDRSEKAKARIVEMRAAGKMVGRRKAAK